MCKILEKTLLFLILLHNFCASSSSLSQFAEIYSASSETVLCDFYQTINVTDGSLQVDKSWLHNGIHYGHGLYAKYNYILEQDGSKIPVEEHIRGCICMIKPCIYACCEPRHLTDNSTGSCVSEEFNELWWNVGLEGEIVRSEVTKTFQWVHRRPQCADKHFLNPEQYEYDQWYLLKVSRFLYQQNQKGNIYNKNPTRLVPKKSTNTKITKTEKKEFELHGLQEFLILEFELHVEEYSSFFYVSASVVLVNFGTYPTYA